MLEGAEASASTGGEGMLEKGVLMRETGEGKENAVRLKVGEASAAVVKDRVERAADGNDGGPANVAAAEVDGASERVQQQTRTWKQCSQQSPGGTTGDRSCGSALPGYCLPWTGRNCQLPCIAIVVVGL